MVTNVVTRRNGGRRGIPIPSFTSTPDEMSTPKENRTLEKTSATWCNDHLLCLDRFLILHFKKHCTSLISLDDFDVVASKVLAQIRSTDAAIDGDGGKPALSKVPDNLLEYTGDERLLYHLIAATSPVLYRLRQVSASEMHAWSTETRLVWCLEAMPFEGTNRKQVLTKLLEQQSIATSNRNSILRAIQDRRKSRDQLKTKTLPRMIEATSKTTNPLEVLIRPGMTVEQRVRARAAVKKKDDASRKEAAIANGRDSSTSSVDREWLVRLADTLWLFASNQMTSQIRFHSTSQTSTSCSVALKDIVTMLRNSLTTGKTLGLKSMSVSKGERASKRQVIDAVIELQTRFPDWINVTDPADGKTLSQEANLRINAVEYTPIRVQLTGTLRSRSAKSAVMKKRPGTNSILHPRNPFEKKPTLASTAKLAAAQSKERKTDPPQKKART